MRLRDAVDLHSVAHGGRSGGVTPQGPAVAAHCRSAAHRLPTGRQACSAGVGVAGQPPAARALSHRGPARRAGVPAPGRAPGGRPGVHEQDAAGAAAPGHPGPGARPAVALARPRLRPRRTPRPRERANRRPGPGLHMPAGPGVAAAGVRLLRAARLPRRAPQRTRHTRATAATRQRVLQSGGGGLPQRDAARGGARARSSRTLARTC